jgi:hypothetical protein
VRAQVSYDFDGAAKRLSALLGDDTLENSDIVRGALKGAHAAGAAEADEKAEAVLRSRVAEFENFIDADLAERRSEILGARAALATAHAERDQARASLAEARRLLELAAVALSAARREVEAAPTVREEPAETPRPVTCNRHDDCLKANEDAKAKGQFGAEHCHDNCCEDCFGS